MKEKLLAEMSNEEKLIDLSKDSQHAKEVLQRSEKLLNEHFRSQRSLAKAYYADCFKSDAERHLIFDLGYSGSVSLGLMKAGLTGKLFDKYYVSQTETNKQRDKEYGTRTVCFTDAFIGGLSIILEECFSPPEGSCLGFEQCGNEVVPVKGAFEQDEKMLDTLDRIHSRCIKHANGFKALFAPYLDCFVFSDKTLPSKLGYHAFLTSPYMELSLLKPIRFADTLCGGVPIELSKKVYDIFTLQNLYPNTFCGTQFMNPENRTVVQRCVSTGLRIGIHLHLHYLFVLEEFVCYLKDFPADFDLIITTTQPQSIAAIKLHCVLCLPRLKKLEVILVDNRGRDVAPWLVATKPYQANYDLFCHLHAKASTEYETGVGQEWRRYLFDNLISHNAAADIIKLFKQNPDWGCMFPEFYKQIADMCIDNGIPLPGVDGEQILIEQLMRRMHINRLFSKDDILYSAGTMMWYRPNALKPLFDLNLTMDDFPNEPVKNGGTIMHAIEQMPGLVCTEQGYKTMIFNEYPQENAFGMQLNTRPKSDEPATQSDGSSPWRGHSITWYIKKCVKLLVPYGMLRVWQRLRYGF